MMVKARMTERSNEHTRAADPSPLNGPQGIPVRAALAAVRDAALQGRIKTLQGGKGALQGRTGTHPGRRLGALQRHCRVLGRGGGSAAQQGCGGGEGGSALVHRGD